MSTPTELHVVLDLPPAPLVLADSKFLAALAEVEANVASLAVTDAASAQAAANLQTRLTKAGSALEAARKQLKQPFIEAGRRIDAVAVEPANRIEAAKTRLKSALAAYDAEQQRIAREAEEARQRELRRLEAIRRAEEETARKRQAEIEEAARKAAAASAAPILDIEDDEPPAAPVKTETEKAIEAVKYAPPVVAARPAGITYKTTLVATVVDVNKLPDVFVEKIAKLRAIQSTFCTGWKEGATLPECAGVRFEVKREAVSTGR